MSPLLAALRTFPLPAPDNLAEVSVVPVVAIAGGLSIPIVALVLAYRKKVLQARIIERAIEQGLTIEEIDELLERQGFADDDQKAGKRRDVPFRRGLVTFAVGAAFYLIENPGLIEGQFRAAPHGGFIGPAGDFIAYLLMGIGVALVVSDLLGLVFGPARRAAAEEA